MRLSAFLLAVLIFAAACEREPAPPEAAAPDAAEVTAVSAPVSDELPGLPAPATGIAFWDHPRQTYNGLMIVATAAGVFAYSMEDGTEVSRIESVNAQGLATGYLGLGAPAAGFVAFYDGAEKAFRFYGVDNESRAFLPLEGGPAASRAVRGFCLGRAQDAAASSLFAIEKGRIEVFNLAPSASGVAVESKAEIKAPDNLVSCAVDIDGRLLVASDDGAIYQIADENAFAKPLARTGVKQAGDLAVVAARIVSEDPEEAPLSTGQILFADLSSGAVHVFQSQTGNSQGVVKITPTDDLPGVSTAQTFAATGANLGGLYRNGVIAFGVANGEDGPVIRIAPTSSLRNALSLPMGEPVSSRGEVMEIDDSGLIIEPNFTPQ